MITKSAKQGWIEERARVAALTEPVEVQTETAIDDLAAFDQRPTAPPPPTKAKKPAKKKVTK